MTEITTGTDRVAERVLKAFVTSVLGRLGIGASDAAQAADVVIEADLRGVETHGINALANRYADLQSGAIVATALPSEVRRCGSVVAFEGHHGYGPVLIPRILPTAADAAGSHGIGLVTLRNTSHWGCPAYYSRWLAHQGLIGIAISNTTPAMPLWGSSAKSVGNNSLTIAAPRRLCEPLVLDISMQQLSWGGLAQAKADGRRLAGHWGYDTAGQPTDDTAEIIASGRVRPMGDHKGSGLAFMFEILTGILAAGATCFEVGRHHAAGRPAHYSQTFIAVRPDAVDTVDGYFSHLETLCDGGHAAPVAPGFAELLLPGERSSRTMAERRRHGIPIRRLRTAIEKLAAASQIPPPPILASRAA
jgi:LDH2 family malate/lactate/ureidoglycolate dehydrogenase